MALLYQHVYTNLAACDTRLLMGCLHTVQGKAVCDMAGIVARIMSVAAHIALHEANGIRLSTWCEYTARLCADMQHGCTSLEGSLVLDLEAGLAVAAALVAAVPVAQADLPAGSYHAYSLLKYLTVHETVTERCVG